MKLSSSVLFFFFLISNTVTAQTGLIDKEKFFTDTAILPVTIIAPMNKILGNSNPKNTTVYPARFLCKLPDSTAVDEPAQLEIRGHLRREVCYIPPLWINFIKEDSIKFPFSSLKKLKLVNGCIANKSYNQWVLMEYLVYKIYNLLTDKSFRVRLLDVTYIDSNAKKKPIRTYSFLLEDVKDLAKRHNCREYTTGRTKTETTDRKQMTMVALFEYMIGNTDWSVTVRHNIKTIIPKDDSTARPIAVPYDFDYSGLVNTIYAIPDPEFPIKSVTERLYRGYPRTMEELNEALEIFNRQKDSIYALIKNFELLSKENKKNMIIFLDQFYSQVKDPGDIKFNFISNARRD